MAQAYGDVSTGLFNNASDFIINGGQFTNINNNNLREKSGFEILQEHVAPAAFHNSKQRFAPPRCHKHTREAVLDELLDWILGNTSRDKRMAWLNGAAGAGKSAICQSIAEICIERGIKVASFFFFRTDGTRNKIDPLVATLVYQLIQLFPETMHHISKAIESNPLIFETAFETQLDTLLIQPILRFVLSRPNCQLLLIIDGVDECKGDETQMNLVHLIYTILQGNRVPLTVLFGSRRENQLQMAFDARNMDKILAQFPLDDHYDPDADIQWFLNDSFDEIKQTHPFRSSLGIDWPSPDHVREIVQKSSGQFIYASIVIKFLASPSSNPSIQLDIIRGLRPSGRLTPFAQLDALYQHIFSQVDDLPAVLNLLAYVIFAIEGPFGTKHVLYLFDLTEADVRAMLAPLTSILVCPLNLQGISFRHASLPDFLRDKKRSKEYCICSLPTRLSIILLNQIASGNFIDVDTNIQNTDLPKFLKHAQATIDLYTSLSAYAPSQQHRAFQWPSYGSNLLKAIQDLDFGDGGKLYDRLLRRIVHFLAVESPGNNIRALRQVQKHHSISHIDILADTKSCRLDNWRRVIACIFLKPLTRLLGYDSR